MEHADAWAVFGRFAAGASVPPEDLERALAHALDCGECARELGPEQAALPETPVDPDALFDRALSAALRTHPDGVARARAAEELGARGLASPAAMSALAGAAERDPEVRVREAARRALAALGAEGPTPRPEGPAPA